MASLSPGVWGGADTTAEYEGSGTKRPACSCLACLACLAWLLFPCLRRGGARRNYGPAVTTPDELQALIDHLTAVHAGGLTLDELAEELSKRPVSYAEIEVIIGALEDTGVLLEGPAPAARPEELMQVLAAARALTAEMERRPSLADIATRVGLHPIAVRRALMLGRKLSERA